MALIITLLEQLKIHFSLALFFSLLKISYEFRCWFTFLLNLFEPYLCANKAIDNATIEIIVQRHTKCHPIFIYCCAHSEWIWNICVCISGAFGLVNNLFRFHMTKHQFNMLGIFHIRIYWETMWIFSTCVSADSLKSYTKYMILK